MTLLHHDITFCNFDRTYESQTQLLASVPHHWIDFTQLRGTNLYCSLEAFADISHQLNLLPENGLTFWGSGNYHYATLARLKRIDRPFSLILFDHHTDLKEGRISSLLSCGSWVRHAITDLVNLKKVIIIGPDPTKAPITQIEGRRQVTIFPEKNLPSAARILDAVPTEHVYISVDKDLLCEHDAKTNWDQGSVSVMDLVAFIEKIIAQKKVEGLDVCGEWPIRPHEHFDHQTRLWIRKNEKSNLMIAKTFTKEKVNPFTKHVV